MEEEVRPEAGVARVALQVEGAPVGGGAPLREGLREQALAAEEADELPEGDRPVGEHLPLPVLDGVPGELLEYPQGEVVRQVQGGLLEHVAVRRDHPVVSHKKSSLNLN